MREVGAARSGGWFIVIDRTALTGTFPDPATCLVVCAACVGAAVVLALVGLRSWLKGE